VAPVALIFSSSLRCCNYWNFVATGLEIKPVANLWQTCGKPVAVDFGYNQDTYVKEFFTLT